MPAVASQQLATIADLDTGAATSAMVQALVMFGDPAKNVYLRRASAHVLAAYAKRFPRTAGSSFVLAKWGDLTIDLTTSIARWLMVRDRGYNPVNPADKAIRDGYEDAQKTLDDIVDLTNPHPRIDPDAVGTPDTDDMGPLAENEGGDYNEADAWADLDSAALYTGGVYP